MNRSTAFVTVVVALSFQACLSVEAARETGAQRQCRYEDKCGNIGAGQSFPSLDECLTRQRKNFLDAWPTSNCEGKINAEKYNVCITAIDNTQCNNLVDQFATATKCFATQVCTGGSGSGTGCNCTNGQTCCSNACTSLQTDRNNCGGCGTSCGSGLSCQSGVCR